MNKIIKIKRDHTFKYKNIKGKIDYIEENIYISINNKVFKFKRFDVIKIKYKGIVFKFELNKNIVKIYEKLPHYEHQWNFKTGVCMICGLKCVFYSEQILYCLEILVIMLGLGWSRFFQLLCFLSVDCCCEIGYRRGEMPCCIYVFIE